MKFKVFLVFILMVIGLGAVGCSRNDSDSNNNKTSSINEDIKNNKPITYDELQTLYINIPKDITLDEAEKLAEETGLPFNLRDGSSSKSIKIAYKEGVTAFSHAEYGDYLEIVFERGDSRTDFPFGSLIYENYKKGITALDIVSGGYWDLNDVGLFMDDHNKPYEGMGNTTYVKSDTREEQLRYIINYDTEEN